MYGLCSMQVMSYETGFQITLPFPRENAWSDSQDFLHPLRFKGEIVPLHPPPSLFAAIICV